MQHWRWRERDISRNWTIRSYRRWVLGFGILLVSGGIVVGRLRVSNAPEVALLTITSEPSGAQVVVAGRDRGRTPLTLNVPLGDVRVTLRRQGYTSLTYTISSVADSPTILNPILWSSNPDVSPVHQPLPGLNIVGARFLHDSQLALVAAVPNSDERQLWLLDDQGGARRVGPPSAVGALAVSSDGHTVAYLARPTTTVRTSGDDARGITEVWTSAQAGERGERRWAVPANTADERLVDLAWAPDDAHLLVVSELRPQGGGKRSRLLWLDAATGQARELIALPSAVVPSSFRWSPRGDRVALLTQTTDRTVLCLVGTDGTSFRSLVDATGAGSNAPPFPPLAWSPDGKGVVYAPSADSAALGGNPARQPALAVEYPLGDRSGQATSATGTGPAWRGDDLLVTFTRPRSSGPVVVHAFPARQDGAGQDLGALPLPAGTPVGAEWDLAHGQALIALRGLNGQIDYYLVRWLPRETAVTP